MTPERKKHPDDHREKQHEGTDIQGGGQGPGDGVGEGHGEAGCLELGGRMASRPGPLAGPVEAEEQAYAQGSGDMCQIEEQPRTAASEDPGAHHPQDKGGSRIVAEGQQPFCLCFGALAVLV